MAGDREDVVKRIDLLLDLRDRFLEAGGSPEAYNEVANMGLAPNEGNPMDSSINGGRCQALALGMLIEYDAYDNRGRSAWWSSLNRSLKGISRSGVDTSWLQMSIMSGTLKTS